MKLLFRSKQFGVLGHHIKWLRNDLDKLNNNNIPAYVSFPGRNLFSREIASSGMPERYQKMIFIQANDSSDNDNNPIKEDNNKEGKILEWEQVNNKFSRRKFSKDSSSENTNRSM